jgi:hypothetical protein
MLDILRPDNCIRHCLMNGGIGTVDIQVGYVVPNVDLPDNFLQLANIYRAHRFTSANEVMVVRLILLMRKNFVPDSDPVTTSSAWINLLCSFCAKSTAYYILKKKR